MYFKLRSPGRVKYPLILKFADFHLKKLQNGERDYDGGTGEHYKPLTCYRCLNFIDRHDDRYVVAKIFDQQGMSEVAVHTYDCLEIKIR